MIFKTPMKFFNRISRVLLSGLVITGILIFGTVFSPVRNISRGTVIDRIWPFRKDPPTISVGRWDGLKQVRMNDAMVAVRKGSIGRRQLPDAWSEMEKQEEENIYGGREAGFMAGLRVGREVFSRLLKKGWNPSDFISAFMVLDDGEGENADAFSFSSSGLNLENFLPDERGDSPGEDIEGVPRIPLSRRVLSIHSQDSSPRLQIAAYEYPGSLVQTKLYYSHQLARDGWEELTGGDGERTFLFRKGERLLSVGISQDPGEEVSLIISLVGR